MSFITDDELRQSRVVRTMERQMRQFIAQARRECQQTPHRFKSISKGQWNAGKSRHICALCELDYSDPIHLSK